jgi:cytochrome P450
MDWTLGAFDSQAESVAHEQAVSLVSRDSFDVIADFAEPLALSMSAWLLTGQPRWSVDIVERLSAWGRDFTHLTGALHGQSLLSEVRRRMTSIRSGTELCRNLLTHYQTFPRSALVYALGDLVAADRMGSEHAAGLLTEMIFATYKNVVNAIANGVAAFFEFPEQFALFLSQQVSSDAVADELLRYGGAVQFTTRVAQENIQLISSGRVHVCCSIWDREIAMNPYSIFPMS